MEARRWIAPTMIAVALVCCGGGAAWWWLRPSPSRATPAAIAPQVLQVPMLTLPAQPVRVLAPAAKKRLALPAPVQADPAQHVVAAARLEPDLRPHTLSTVLDQSTGEFRAYDTPEPLPWFAPAHRGEIGIAYGLRSGIPMGRLYLDQGLLDIKALRLGARATLDQDGQWFAGVGLAYRW